jgi:hypothetical protein
MIRGSCRRDLANRATFFPIGKNLQINYSQTLLKKIINESKNKLLKICGERKVLMTFQAIRA